MRLNDCALAVWLVSNLAYGARAAPEARYLGSEVCALCHKSIADTHSKTAMANTWQTARSTWLPDAFEATVKEGPYPALISSIQRTADQFLYSTKLPSLPEVTVPVEAMVGGQRHGVGFLTRIAEVNGSPLARPVLVQTRYAWSVREGKLVLAPGCPAAKPTNFQTAFGLPLSLEYERRCLECHGQPNTLGAGAKGGVQCETCHGPGSGLLQALAKGDTHSGIVNSKRLSADGRIEVCAKCHVGLTKVSDPSPDDLLVANQVVALKTSECFLQSRKAITCETCHNPHEDAPASVAASQAACLSCHSVSAKPHAGLCPVNTKTDCLGCHMPAVDVGPFHLVDHQIRVHPEQQVAVSSPGSKVRSEFEPVSEYLEQIEAGEFGAGSKSTYLGRKNLADLPPAVAATAATLAYGQASAPLRHGTTSIALRRMPRDFRWQAKRLEDSAELRLVAGDFAGALAQSQAALAIQPDSLRALVTLGRALSQSGDLPGATAILQRAKALYPDDANAAFNLGRNLGKQGRSAEAIASYKRAIVSDPDLVSAYLNLGKALLATGDINNAIRTLRSGLQTDPLNPSLYRAYGTALSRNGNTDASLQAMKTASRIDAVAPAQR